MDGDSLSTIPFLFEDNKFVVKFLEVIQKRFPEITLKGKHSLRGVIDGRFQSININNRFLKKVEDLGNIFLKYGYLCKVSEKKNEKVSFCSRNKPKKTNFPYQKGEFIVKINWQNFLIFYKLSNFYEQKPNLLDEEFDKWFEEKLKNANVFADYKELFNVNSTIKSFREYIEWR